MVNDGLSRAPKGGLVLFCAALAAMLITAAILFALTLHAGLERAHAARAGCAVLGMVPEPASPRSLDVLCVDLRDGRIYRPA